MSEKRSMPLIEEVAVYVGQTDASFIPFFAGISFPDPTYEITRQIGDVYVFEYVISGQGTVTQDQQTFHVKAGDAYILRQGRFHHYYSDKKDPWKNIWFNVSGNLVRHLLSDYDLNDIVKIPALHDGSYLYAIKDTIKKEPVHCKNELALLLHQYIQFLSDFLGNRMILNSPAMVMKNYIEQNLTSNITIDDIAASVPLSRSRCIHLFKEVYHITPYNYYLKLRLELAENLLRNTLLPVHEIAQHLNFPDCQRFSAFFKKYSGQSPTRFRKNTLSEE